jgi:HK97 family phage major capsid protein
MKGIAMNMHVKPRGIMYARAEAQGAAALLAELQKTFADFKEAHAEQIKGVQKKFDDVVSRDKLDRVNAQVGELQAALDRLAAQQAATQMGGAGSRKAADTEYTSAFMAHMKRGEVMAALTKGADADGGFLAPREWDRTITDKLIIVSEMRGIASVMTIGNAGFSKLYNLRGTASGWVGETAARPETATPQFGSMSVTTGEVYANPFATQQMLDDSEVDLETWLAGEVETEFAFQEGLAFVSGTGANGRPNGILTYVTGGANAAANPLGAITTVNSGAASTVTADGIVNLVHALPSAFTGNARFAMNRTVQGVVRLLKDTTNQYLWQPSYASGTPATLAGYPISELAALPNLAASSKSLLFGDFARTYRIVDRMGTRVLRDPFSNKPYVGFYTTKRVGGFVDNPEAMKALNTSI